METVRVAVETTFSVAVYVPGARLVVPTPTVSVPGAKWKV